VLLAFAACAGGPPASPQGSTARGLIEADPAAPEGAKLYQRPAWHVGDSYELVRGGILRGKFTVEAIADGDYLVRDAGGNELRRDMDLANVGQWEDGEPTLRFSPRDLCYHWPLWVGKKWRCEFAEVTPRSNLMMEASYEVEDLDTVTVPAGTFEALRISRTLQLSGSPQQGSRMQIIWYAPSIGTEVRRIMSDSEVELVAWRPAGEPSN
jgi:hypothetical protein